MDRRGYQRKWRQAHPDYDKNWRRAHWPMIRKRQKKYQNSLVGYTRFLYYGLVQSCKNPNDSTYKYFGARGIQCRFTNVEDFLIHVLYELKIDPRGFEIGRINAVKHFERGNIRFVTHKQNHSGERKTTKPCSSIFKGVAWVKRNKKWKAAIRVNYKSIYLGIFINEVNAAKAYDIAALKYFGDFALTNEMMGLYESEVNNAT